MSKLEKPERTASLFNGKTSANIVCYVQDIDNTYEFYHDHDFYEFLLIKNGMAVHYINGEREIISEGELMLIRPDDCHKFLRLHNNDMTLMSFSVCYELMDDITKFLGIKISNLHKSKMPPKKTYQANHIKSVVHMMNKVVYIVNETKNDESQIIRNAKPTLAYLLNELLNVDTTNATMPEWLVDLVEKMSIEQNFVAGYNRMVELCPVSTAHMSRSFFKYLGIKPIQFINEKRIKLALDIISYGQTNSEIICNICGFDSMSNFYLNFKNVVGCSPGEYIKSLQDKED